MKIYTRIIIALVLIAIPPLGRYFWFYQGAYNRTQPVTTPGYSELSLPNPPLSTLPAPVEGDVLENYIVLVDFDHGNNFVLSEIENLTQPLIRRGAKLEVSNFDLSLNERLKYCDAYVVIAPTYAFTDDEIAAVHRFVQRGGRLLAIADPTRNYYASDPYSYDPNAKYLSGVDVANLLLAPYDIAFNEDYVYNLIKNEANYRNVFFAHFNENVITKNLSSVVLYGTHSIHTTQEVLIQGDENTLSSSSDQGDQLAVAAATGDGNVLAIGDLNFLTSPYYQVEDNYQFVENLTGFLLRAQRSYELADFPYLFHHTVNVLTPPDDVTNKDYISTLTDIQLTLKTLDLTLVVSDTPIVGEDLLVTGTYMQRDDLKEYIEPFGLEFSREPIKQESSVNSIFDTPMPTPTPIPTQFWNNGNGANTQDVVMVPGLGKFNINDVGLILYTSTHERNTLTLIASNSAAIRELADIVFRYGDLSMCLTTDTTAVCSLESGYSGNGFNYNNYDYDSGNGSEMIESTPTPLESEVPSPEITPVGLR